MTRPMRLPRVSPLEEALLRQMAHLGLPAPVRELRFAPPRRWRFDFSFPDAKLAVEVEGGLYTHGRHTRIGGFEGDCEKYAHAVLDGWRVLRVTAKQIASGQAVQWVESALRRTSATGEGAQA